MGNFLLISQEKLEQLENKLSDLIKLVTEQSTIKMEDWLSQEDVQKLLDLGVTSLWALRKRKEIVYSKVGSKIFYSKKSIERWLDRNEC